MNRLRVLSLTMLTLLSASRLPGQAYGRPQQDIYIQPVVCNDGTISVFVAQAYLNVWNGRSPWLIQGWYEVKVGTCQKVGSNSNHEMHYSSSGMFGTGDDAVSFLAFAFTDSRGAFGAANVPVGGAYESSKQQFCVKEGDAFEYELNGEQSVLSRQCQAGYHLISASVAFYGYSFRPDDPGPRDYLHVNLGANDRAIPLGKPTSGGQATAQSAAANSNHVPPPLPPADAPGPVAGTAPGSHADDPIGAGGFITPSPAHPQQLTARLIFGDAVRFDGSQWRFENGSAVPAQLIDQSGRPPLLPKQQYSTEQAPVAGYIQTIKKVLASFAGCKEYTDSAKTQFSYSVETSEVDLDDYGEMVSRTLVSPPSGAEKITYGQGAALANLDLTHAIVEDHGCLLLAIQCKNGSSCIRSEGVQRGSSADDRALSWVTIEINTREQGAKILNALTAVAPFYPAGDGETHEIP